MSCINLAEWIARESDHMLNEIKNGRQAPTDNVPIIMLANSLHEATGQLMADKPEHLMRKTWSRPYRLQHKSFVASLSADVMRFASAGIRNTGAHIIFAQVSALPSSRQRMPLHVYNM